MRVALPAVVFGVGKLAEYLFGEAGVINLVGGIIRVSIAVVIILSAYALVLERAAGDQIFIRATLERTNTMLLACLVILFLGVWGGFEVGRYVQTELNKRRTRT